MKHRMEITENTADEAAARIIIMCNGYEIDVRADGDGIMVEIQKPDRAGAYCSVDFSNGEEAEA